MSPSMRGSAAPGERPVMVELVGLAGAGKTTLARLLSRRDGGIVVGTEIELKRIEQVPIFVANLAVLFPLLLRRSGQSRQFSWNELKALVYLRAWPQVLRRQAKTNGSIVLIDHGPVFKLATLHAFGPDKLQTPAYEKWWGSMFKRWAHHLDMIVWLDAPVAVLKGRIDGRDQRHSVKGKAEPETYSFLSRYRASYERVLAQIAANGGPDSLTLNTDELTIEDAADRVLAACYGCRAGAG